MKNLKEVLSPYLKDRFGPLNFADLYALFGEICLAEKERIPNGWSSHDLVEAAFLEELLFWDEEDELYYVNHDRI